MTCIRSAVLISMVIGIASTGYSDWLRFRGPNGSGVIADATSVPTAWSPNANIAWKSPLPGTGVSSPIVVGDRVFVTCYSGYGMNREEPGDMNQLKRHLVCIDATSGEQLWAKTIDPVLPEDPFSGAGVPAHGYASHTPTSDGERVYVYFGKTGAMAFDMEGNLQWQTSLGTESDPWLWGSSSSPIVFDDLLIVTASAESQSIVGLDKKTGSIVWQQEAAGTDGLWGTPMLFEVNDNRTDLVVCVPGEIWGLDPKSGDLRWFSEATEAEHAYASVVAQGDVLYAVTGRGGGSVAVRAGGAGDVSGKNVLWTGNTTGSFASPVTHNGRIYSVASGVMTVLDAESGEKVSELRLRGGSGGGGSRGRSLDYASPLVVGEHLYYLNGTGNMFVFKLGDELEQLRVNRVTAEGETFGGTPAVSDGRLYIRSNKHLYCVADKGDSVAEDDQPKVAASDAPSRGGAGQRGGRGGGGGGRFDPAAFFERLDQNQDGKLTANELSAGPMAGRLGDLDTDKDQSVSLDEFRSGIGRIFGGGGRGGGRGGRGGFGGQREDNRPERPKRPKMAE